MARIDREASAAVAQAVMNKGVMLPITRGTDLDSGESDRGQSSGGSTLQAVLGIRETVTFVQNTVGMVLDQMESLKNLLNWTHPRKTCMVRDVSRVDRMSR